MFEIVRDDHAWKVLPSWAAPSSTMSTQQGASCSTRPGEMALVIAVPG